MTNFVIFGLPRTGSSLLGAMLAAHPAIACDTEVFHHQFWPHWRYPLYRCWRFYPYPYLDYCAWRARRQGKPLYGFKLFPNHVHSPRAVIMHLHHRGWRILHIQRRDPFEQTLSLLVANRTGRFDGTHADLPPRLAIDPLEFDAALRRRCAKIRRNDAILQGIDHIDLFYEDDLQHDADWNRTLARICVALGAATAPAHTAYGRTWPEPYDRIVVNYEDLVRRFQNNKLCNDTAPIMPR